MVDRARGCGLVASPRTLAADVLGLSGPADLEVRVCAEGRFQTRTVAVSRSGACVYVGKDRRSAPSGIREGVIQETLPPTCLDCCERGGKGRAGSLGLGRIVALYCSASTLYQIR
jgi:hypothetical protein